MKTQAIIFRYGLVAGLIIITLMIAGFWGMEKGYLDYGSGEVLGFLSMFLGFSLIYAAIHKVRKEEYNGYIPFRKAFMIGLWISLLVAAIYVVVWISYSLSTGSQFLTEYYQPQFDAITNSGKSETEILKATQELQTELDFMKTPLMQVTITFLEIFPVGLLVTLISAYTLSRSKQKEA